MSSKIDELYYELGLETEKFERGLQGATGKLAAFREALKNPAIIGAALGAALTAVAQQAIHMAEEFENGIKRVQATLPPLEGDLEELKRGLNNLSIATGVTVQDLTEGALAIGKAGVSGQEELIDRLRVIADLSVATGVGMTELAGSMSVVMAQFDLASEDFDKVAASLFQMARGRLPLEQLLHSLEQSTSITRNLGLDFETAAKALAQLGSEGRTTLRAVADLRKLGQAGEDGRAQIQRLAAQIDDTGDAGAELRHTVDELTNSMSHSSALIRADFTATMRELGATILPPVAWGLSAIVTALDPVGAAMRKAAAAAGSIQDFAAATELGENTTRDWEKAAKSAERLHHAFSLTADTVPDIFKDLSTEELDKIIAGLIAIEATAPADFVGKAAEERLASVTARLQAFRAGIDADAALRELTKDFGQQVGFGQKPSTQDIQKDAGPTWKNLPPETPEQIAARLKREAAARAAAAKADAERARAARALEVQIKAVFSQLTASMDQLSGDVNAGLRRTFNEMTTQLEALRAKGVAVSVEMQAAYDQMAQHLVNVDALTPLTERATELQEEFDAANEAMGGPNSEALTALESKAALLVEDARAYAESTRSVPADYKEALAFLKLTEKEWAKIVDHIADASKGSGGNKLEEANRKKREEQEAALSKMRETASAIQNAVVGALQLANAFGGVTDETARIITNLTQVATQLPQLIKLLETLNTATKAATGDIIGAALGVLGGLVSLFSGGGPSPEEQRRAELLQQNNDAIAGLSRNIGELGVVLGDVSGRMFTDVQTALIEGERAAAFAQNDRPKAIGDANQFVFRELERLGLTMSDVRKIAGELGVTFANSIPTYEELRILVEAMAEAELAQFADTYAGQLRALRLEFELFDIDKPIDQLKRLQELAGEFAGDGPNSGNFNLGEREVFNELAKADLATQAGRDAAQAALEEIFRALQDGSLTPAQLGDLTPDELLAFLEEFKRTLDAANETTDPQGTTQGFNISRTITEAQGSVVIALLTTQTFWQEELYNLIASGALVGTLEPPPLPPPVVPDKPNIPPGPLPEDTITPIEVTVNLSITGVLDEQRATDMGRQVVDGMVSKLDMLNGARLRTRKLLTGDVVRS